MRRVTTFGLVVAWFFYVAAAFTLVGLLRIALEEYHSPASLYILLALSLSSFVSGIVIHLITVIAIDVEHIRDHQEKHQTH